MALIAASLLASNFLRLQDECAMLNKSEVDWFHLDVMDGHFVPNISFGPMLIDFFRKATSKTCDVHLMITEPARYAELFKKAGADILSVHLEACPNLHSNIQQIKNLGMLAGVAINPHTPVKLLKDVLAEIDLVCIMSVNPGFGGQSFIPNTLTKISELKAMIRERSLNVKIEVDGGVTEENAKQIIEAGADVLVAGSAIFNSANPPHAISRFKAI